MRTTACLFALTLALSGPVLAQVSPQAEAQPFPSYGRNRLYLELAGNSALGFTVNYELGVSRTFGVRLGMGLDIYSQTRVWPVTVVALVGNGSSKLELSGGVVMAQENTSGDWHWNGNQLFPTGFVGYRYQPPRGFLLRVGVIPLLWTNNQLPWFGLSLGTVF